MPTFTSSSPISLIANVQQSDNKEYFEMQALCTCKADFFFSSRIGRGQI